MQSAAKVGGLVVLFSAMSVGVLGLLNQSLFGKASTPYKVVFSDAGGLTAGSRVMVSGVLVGQVEKVVLEGPGRAVARITVDAPHELTVGSTATLPSSLISVGDREIQITAGPGPALPPNGIIQGALESPLDSMIPDLGDTMTEVRKTLVSLNALLSDPALKKSVTGLAESGQKALASGQKTLDAGTKTAASVERLVNRFDGIAASSSGKLTSILASADKSMTSVAAMTSELEKVLKKGDFQEQGATLLKSLNAAAIDGRDLVAELKKVVTDPAMQNSFKTSAANVEKMTASGTKVAKDFESISAEGIVASKKVNELLVKVNSMADDVKKLLEQFKGTIEKIGGTQKKLGTGITAEADLMTNSEAGGVRTDVNVSIPIGKEKAIIGMYDAFESNKINLQLQRQFAEGLEFRYGVYASKLGLGVDYRLASGLQARGDLYGLNDTRFDLRLRYDFSQSIYGWLGMDRVFDRNSPVIGIGIRRKQ